MRYFVTAIGTDSGKTLVSAILVQALKADYWKPIQSGEPADIDTIKSLIDSPKSILHPSVYRFQMPASPHQAAAAENIIIDRAKIRPPVTSNALIVEGVGGLLVPLNDQYFIVDLIEQLNYPVILVANLYLGSINHTLLSINEIQRRGLAVKGIIFNGSSNPESERIILLHSGYELLLHIQPEKEITPDVVKKYAEKFIDNL